MITIDYNIYSIQCGNWKTLLDRNGYLLPQELQLSSLPSLRYRHWLTGSSQKMVETDNKNQLHRVIDQLQWDNRPQYVSVDKLYPIYRCVADDKRMSEWREAIM